MSKLYVPALALALVGGSAQAQHSAGVTKASKMHDGATIGQRPTTTPASGAATLRAPFWTEDFSGGAIPSGWTNVDDLTPSGDEPVTFVWSNDPAAVEPAALGYADSETFNATGATNGYLWANSDRGLPSAPATNHLTRLTTGAIDCSGRTSVLFSMQSLIGVFDNDADTAVKVRVSTDGLTWTDFAPFPCLVTGAAAPPCVRWSDNPESVNVDISSVAANQPQVFLQLQWRGGWEYFWAIDDMALSPLPDYEIAMNYAYNSTTGTGEEYGRIPSSQLPGTMNVGAELFNLGLNEQTNVVLNVAFEDADGNPVSGFAGTIDVGTIASGATVVADGNINIPTGLANGVYTSTFTLSGDNIALDLDPSDNEKSRNFEVTSDVYAIDAIGNYPDGVEQLQQFGSASFTDNAEMYLMSMYVINSNMSPTGVIVQLSPNTVAGATAEIQAMMLDTVDVIQLPATVSNAIDGVTSATIEITQAHVDAGEIGIQFEQPVDLTPGAYFAAVRVAGSGTVAAGDAETLVLDDVTVPQPAWTSAIYLPVDFNEDGTEGRHSYTNGNAFGIRLTTLPTVGIQEPAELAGISLFPNPTTGVFQITSDRTEVLFVEVTDALGKIVRTTNFSSTTTMDLSDLAAGVYSVAVANGTERSVQRVTLK